MGSEQAVDLRDATTATLEALLRQERENSERLAEVIDLRMRDGSATPEEVRALVAHRTLKQLT